MNRLDDETKLIEGLCSGDQQCCKKLVENYWNELHFLALRLLVDEASAKDCAQEAFIKAITKIDSFKGVGSFKAWLHQIVVNEALIELRKKSSRKEESLEKLMLDFDDSGHYVESYQGQLIDIDTLQKSIEVKQEIKKSIDKLPEKFRIVLILRDYEGYSTKEVAEKMDMSEQNVKVSLHRARLAMRNLLHSTMNKG